MMSPQSANRRRGGSRRLPDLVHEPGSEGKGALVPAEAVWAEGAWREVPRHPDLAEVARRIAERAYQLYVARGRVEGGALEDWLEAEREITLGWGPAATG